MLGNKAIVVITVHKEKIDMFEEISIRQAFKVLSRHPIRIVCAQGLNVTEYRRLIPQAQFDFIHPKWMRNIQMFNRLKMHPLLYEKYRSYEYLLFYEPDAFVFRDEMDFWCSCGYDYIGAPWFAGFTLPLNDTVIGVGNGGFSLRKVSSCLKALYTFSLLYRRHKVIEDFRKMQISDKVSGSPGFLLSLLGIGNNSHYLLNGFRGHDDIFWGLLIKERFQWFKVADYNEALKFSFEVKPRILFEWNKESLPFGCHAWRKYDIEFWKPFIKREGYRL